MEELLQAHGYQDGMIQYCTTHHLDIYTSSPNGPGHFFHDFEVEYLHSAISFLKDLGYDDLSPLFRDLLEVRFEYGADLWTIVQVVSDPLELPAFNLTLGCEYLLPPNATYM